MKSVAIVETGQCVTHSRVVSLFPNFLSFTLPKKYTQNKKMAGVETVFKSRGACASSSHTLNMCFVVVVLLGIPSVMSQSLSFTENDIKVLQEEVYQIKLLQTGAYNTSLKVAATIQHPDIVQLDPQTLDIPAGGGDTSYDISAHGISPGHSEIYFTVTPDGYVQKDALFLRITVMISKALNYVSYIVGWVYFAAWSVSFYPQIYTNYSRKSVVGLNFDFLALNIMGFTMYSLFNCGLYFSKAIQINYFNRFPRGLNPVQLNDVFFSTHAAFATIITITQCCIYEREGQRVSTVARSILATMFLVVIITGILSVAHVIEWLDFLYYCSYIKLFITFIKYLPQAIMNYRRKSTVGWSIGNIILDFTGGFLSIFQMVVNAYNYNDWVSFFGDFTKFGLGLFSLAFDIFFMLQHYVFYRDARYIRLPGASSAEDQTPNEETGQPSEEPYQGAPA
ncbi:cystinosin homolog isoform X2 [Trichoplusia ni]|uniref:Cystinosin homolog isoform X2 n=1 Tax=Trichoplusia ni TaxID=7111 RepID=A0A7E5WFS3_TRINI|nr:cystinosin homolog isoform X2 [Trichoplusia ni]